jgi:hypothetical protein
MKLYAASYDPKRPTVLCINSDQFNRDFDILQNRSTRYNWVAILDQDLSVLQASWMPERLRIQGLYVNESGPEVDAAWNRATVVSAQVIADVRKAIPNVDLVAVMASNWDYWNEEGMRRACKAAGLPFLVLLREHVLAPDWREETSLYGLCKSIPPVTAVAVAGSTTLKMIEMYKLQPHAALAETGLPRFDIWDAPTPPAYDRPVVLFSYRKGYGAPQHFVEMLKIFTAVAARHPSVPFLVKAKHKVDLGLIEEIMPPHGENVTVMDAHNLKSVLVNARGVIGFRSLALYEALLSGVPILVPRWGEADIDPTLQAPSPIDERLRGFMEFFTDADAFERALDQLATNGRPAADLGPHQALFAQYFRYSPTETSTVRVEQFVADNTR